MTNSIVPVQLACPRCGAGLGAEIVGPLALHRCADCGGVWLDPGTVRMVCEGETDPEPRSGATRQGAAGRAEAAPRDDHIRYLRCPVCSEVMNRVNFARVLGVVLDVCRPHGAWFDAGELRAVQKFVRGPGLRMVIRRRELGAEQERLCMTPAGGTGGGIDLIDVLAGIPDRFDVPSTRSPARWFMRTGILAVGGFALLWSAFHRAGGRWQGGAVMATLGGMLLFAAFRALNRGLAAREQDRRGNR